MFSFRSQTTIRSSWPPSSVMTLRSRSCVIGRGVWTFSTWRAMALASKTPTQMGSTRWPSTSRSTTMGMLVIGSTIRPLMDISISTPLASSARNIGGTELAVNERFAKAAPGASWGRPRAISTGTVAPTRLSGPSRWTILKCGVRPETRPSASTDSTSTWSCRPTSVSLRRRCHCCWCAFTTCSRRSFSSSGTSSSSRSAVVPGRGE